MEPTYSERLAARLRYPQGLFGYSPNEHQYWSEDLPWANALLNPAQYGLEPTAAARELAELRGMLKVWNENMAPRFPAGTSLAGLPLKRGAAVSVGTLLAWWEPGEAQDCFDFARVVRLVPGCLHLAYDNGGRVKKMDWWEGGPGAAVLRITHYCSMPYLS